MAIINCTSSANPVGQMSKTGSSSGGYTNIVYANINISNLKYDTNLKTLSITYSFRKYNSRSWGNWECWGAYASFSTTGYIYKDNYGSQTSHTFMRIDDGSLDGNYSHGYDFTINGTKSFTGIEVGDFPLTVYSCSKVSFGAAQGSGWGSTYQHDPGSSGNTIQTITQAFTISLDATVRTLTLDAQGNGGKVGGLNTKTVYYIDGDNVNLSTATIQGNTATKDGYKCIGWSLTQNKRAYDSPITMDSNKTVYAQFRKRYSATFNQVGGSNPIYTNEIWNNDPEPEAFTLIAPTILDLDSEDLSIEDRFVSYKWSPIANISDITQEIEYAEQGEEITLTGNTNFYATYYKGEQYAPYNYKMLIYNTDDFTGDYYSKYVENIWCKYGSTTINTSMRPVKVLLNTALAEEAGPTFDIIGKTMKDTALFKNEEGVAPNPQEYIVNTNNTKWYLYDESGNPWIHYIPSTDDVNVNVESTNDSLVLTIDGNLDLADDSLIIKVVYEDEDGNETTKEVDKYSPVIDGLNPGELYTITGVIIEYEGEVGPETLEKDLTELTTPFIIDDEEHFWLDNETSTSFDVHVISQPTDAKCFYQLTTDKEIVEDWTEHENEYTYSNLSFETPYILNLYVEVVKEKDGITYTKQYRCPTPRTITTEADQAEIYVHENGTWKTGKVWIYANGWKPAKKVYVYKDGQWKRSQ